MVMSFIQSRFVFVALALVLAAAAVRAGGAQSPQDTSIWRVDTPERPFTAGSVVRETVWTAIRLPGGRFDRIGVHRYRTSGPSVATLLHLPGTNMNGVAAVKDEAHNLWLFLAARGIEVFTLDYRTHAIPNDTPAAELTTHGQPAGTPNRRALVIAGDGEDTKKAVADLIDQFGFDVVDAEPSLVPRTDNYSTIVNGTAAMTVSHMIASRPPLSDMSMNDQVSWSIENGSEVLAICARTTSFAGV